MDPGPTFIQDSLKLTHAEILFPDKAVRSSEHSFGGHYAASSSWDDVGGHLAQWDGIYQSFRSQEPRQGQAPKFEANVDCN